MSAGDGLRNQVSGSISPLVGRKREQAALRAALADTLAGQGGLVLISGEAGIGKTALAEALTAEAAAQGARVLVGRCYDLSETPPYGPWRELFARAPTAGLPSLPTVVSLTEQMGDAPASQETFAHVLAYLTALAAGQPLVLLLDDLHWADHASVRLLRFAVRQLAGQAVLLVATYRADELRRDHPLYQVLPLLVRETQPVRLDLRPLPDAAVRALVAARYRLAEADERRLVAYLDERATGNPFFAGEVLRTLEETETLRQDAAGWMLADLTGFGVPPLLRQVIDTRVDRLGEEVRRLLAVAALIGQPAPLYLWATVAGVAEEALLDVAEQAAAARLLDMTTTGIRFVHALIREALYEGIAPLRRRGWHQRAAAALMALPDPDPDAVAYHLQQAGDPQAATWLLRAGERAQRAYAWLTAAERYEAALALPTQADADPRERARLLLTLAQFWRYEDRYRGIGYLDEAERLAEAAGDAALAAAARFDRGHLRLLGRDHRALADRVVGLAAMAAALPALETLAPAERVRLPALQLQRVSGEERYHRGALMYWLAGTGRLGEVLALAPPLLADGPRVDARGLAGLGLAYCILGRPAEAEHALAESEARFRAAGQHVEVYYRLTERLIVTWAYYFDQPARWQPLLARIEEAERLAAGAWRVEPVQAVVRWRLLRGAWTEVRQFAVEHPSDGWFLAAMAGRDQGETATAWAAIERYLPAGPATAPGSHNLLTALECQRLAAALALDADDRPTACAWLAAHDRWLAWSGAVLGQAEGHLGWAAYHRAAGDLALAHEHAARALAHATKPRQPLALLAAHRLLGELATAAGQHADAKDHLGHALALADACAAPYERALTLLALAELALATDERARAATALEDARTLLLPLDARLALARAGTIAARLAAVPARPYTAGLSLREVEVLRLVAEGLTNAQIATRLFLSPRTVDQHLRAIFNKLGVGNRAAAAARWSAEHALTGEEP
ncbi:MAG: ATP-binding protein [Thermomicrobiales bacterium]